jgi:hypothetical protein
MDEDLKKLEPLERIERLQELLKRVEEIRDKAEKDIIEIKKEMERAAFEVEQIRREEEEVHFVREHEEEAQPATIETAAAPPPQQQPQTLEEQVRGAGAAGLGGEQNIYNIPNQETIDRLEYMRNQAAEGRSWSDEDYSFFQGTRDQFREMYIKDASREQKRAVTRGQEILDQIEKYKKG